MATDWARPLRRHCFIEPLSEIEKEREEVTRVERDGVEDVGGGWSEEEEKELSASKMERCRLK